jgi:hypothetical protein
MRTKTMPIVWHTEFVRRDRDRENTWTGDLSGRGM